MRFINKYFPLRIYRKITFSYFVIVLIAIFLICAVILSFSFLNSTKEIHSNSKSMLEQTCYSSEVIHGEVGNIVNQIISDNTIISFLYSREDDKVTNYYAFLTLTKLVNAYPYIEYIELYNPSYDKFFSTINVPDSLKDTFKQNTLNIIEKKDNNFLDIVPRKFTIDWSYKQAEELPVISYVFLPDFYYNSKCAIVINIDEAYVNKSITSALDSPDYSSFILNSHGQVVSHTERENYMLDYSNKEYVQDILASDLDHKTSTYQLDGTNQLITYVKSQIFDWYFVSIKPYNALFENIYTIWKITFIVAFIFIILGILISIQVTNNIYSPFKLLIEKVKQPLTAEGIFSTDKADEFKFLTNAFYQYDEMTKTMETYIDKSSQVMERNYILNIIKGSKRYFEETDKIIEKPDIFLQESNFCIVLFSIDNKRELELTGTQENQALSCFTLGKVASKLLSKHYKNYAIITDENEVSVLIQLLDDDIGSDFYNTLEVIQKHIMENLKATVSISVGDIVYTKNEISDSYRSARKYIKCKLFYGHNSIINSEKIKAHISSKTVRYPYSIEKKTFEGIKLQNIDSVNNNIMEFISFISSLSYSQAINYSDQFILSIYNHFIDIGYLEDKDFASCFDTINEIDLAETIDDISSQIKKLCANMITHLHDKSTHQTSQKHRKIIDEARVYINAHYTDPNMSLELLADKVALSPGYLGKLFKNTTSVTFVTYLNGIRLEKAKELLVSTNMSASKIGETVGIYNSTYFSTLFKKAYGISPSQYRGSLSKTS